MIGFEAFLLMNDNSTDDTQCLLDAYAEEGIVIRVPQDVDNDAARHLQKKDTVFDVCAKHLQNNPSRFDPSRTWMMTHDTDEFVWFNKTDSAIQSLGDAIRKLIERYRDHVKSLPVPRLLVGSSGHNYYERGLVIDRFNKRFDFNSCPKRNGLRNFLSSRASLLPGHDSKQQRRRLFHQNNPISYCRDRQRSDSYDLVKSISHVGSLAQKCTQRAKNNGKRTGKKVSTPCTTTHHPTLRERDGKNKKKRSQSVSTIASRAADRRILDRSRVGRSIAIMHYMTKSR